MASRESKEQGRSGRRGTEASREQGAGQQPRQGSGRVEAPSDGDEKKHFPEGRAPSEQGENPGSSGGSIAERQRGASGAGTGGSGSAEGRGRSQEAASGGSPGGDHTRSGRQKTPGNRHRG